MNEALLLLVSGVCVGDASAVPYICLAGSRLHNRPLCIRSGLSVFPAPCSHPLLVDLVSFALFVLVCHPVPVACRLTPYGSCRLLLAGCLRGYIAVGCILGCGDWADRLACLMYLSG